MEKITNILEKKQRHFHTVEMHAAASDALYQMCCENVDYLVVMADDRFMGLLTEHDIASRAMFARTTLDALKVKDVMNAGLPMATIDNTVEHCMKLMQRHNVRYIPVFENFTFRGIVSSEDILQEAVYNKSLIFDLDNEQPVVGYSYA